jgi:tripartite-type tricarboxylate transporter receptor subunit TctC
VAAAEPDGYTVLMHHIGMSTAPSLYSDLAYKPLESFMPVGLVTEVPMTIIARKDFEPNTLTELVEYVKANKDQVTYANAGSARPRISAACCCRAPWVSPLPKSLIRGPARR